MDLGADRHQPGAAQQVGVRRHPGDVGADGDPQPFPHRPHRLRVRRARRPLARQVDRVTEHQHTTGCEESGQCGDQAFTLGQMHQYEAGVDEPEPAGCEVRGGDVGLQHVESRHGPCGEETYVAVDGEDARHSGLVQQPAGDGARSGAHVEAAPSGAGAQCPQPRHGDVVVGEGAEVDAFVLVRLTGAEDGLAVATAARRAPARSRGRRIV